MNRHPLSAPGKLWVECDQCLAHGICENSAPANFASDGSTYYVVKQPENEEEERQCREAVSFCPISAIRDDG